MTMGCGASSAKEREVLEHAPLKAAPERPTHGAAGAGGETASQGAVAAA